MVWTVIITNGILTAVTMKKEEGVNYIYAQDAVTGEWSYCADKSK